MQTDDAGPCRSCGTALGPADRFCPRCGTRAGEDAPRDDTARTGLIIGATAFGLVLLLGGGLFLLGEGEPPSSSSSSSRRSTVVPSATTTPSATPSPDASPEPGTSPSATASPDGVPRAARQLSTLLQSSPGSADGVAQARAGLEECRLPPSRALRVFEQAAQDRRLLLREVEVLRPGRLPEGAALAEALERVWSARVLADDALSAWARAQLDGCRQDPDDPDLATGRERTQEAQRSAEEFAGAWSPVAARYSLPDVVADDL